MASVRGRDLGEALLAAEERRPMWALWWTGALHFVTHKPLGAFGAFIALVLIVVAVFAPWIAPQPYDKLSSEFLANPFTRGHIMGTDGQGRDIFSRIIYGARVSVAVGFGAVAISAVVATAIGVVSGYFGGWLDTVIQRVVDAWMSIPTLIVLITVVRMLEPSLSTVTIAIGISLAGVSSRVSRSAVLGVKGNQYMEAAQAIGAGHTRIITHYVLPNIFATILVLATAQLGFAILIEAMLSFLGFGVPPPTPAWGAMLGGQARDFILRQPWLSFWPGLAICLVVYGFNVFGDAMRDVLDPRMRGVT